MLGNMPRLPTTLLLTAVLLPAAAGCARAPAPSPAATTAPPTRAERVVTLDGSLAALADENPGVRMVGAMDLATLGPKAKPAAERLVKALKEDPDATVRLYAARALGAIGLDAGAVPALVAAVEKDRDDSVRADAAEALPQVAGRNDAAVTAALTRAQHDPSPRVREHAARALRRLNPKDSPPEGR
jgi:hypothetical protein